MTLVLGCFLREDVAFKGLTSLDGAACADREALFGATLTLHFGHEVPLLSFALLR